MKITDVQTALLTGPCTDDPYLSQARKRRSAAFVEIQTDTGLVGLGETYAGYFCPELVPPTVEFFRPILLGRSGEEIAEIWEDMYHCANYWCRVGLGTAVLNGIEAALWDLKGKAHGLPVYMLLGDKKHDRLPAYATGGPSNYPLSQLAAKIDFYHSLGFKGFKVGAGAHTSEAGFVMPDTLSEVVELEGAKAEFLRRHVGPDMMIMMDGHMGNSPTRTWDLETALAVMKAVEPYDLFFFEEPLHYTDPEGYGELCRNTTVPIAGGECLTAAYEWRVFVKEDSFDIGQPDASFTGGLGEFCKVAGMLEEHGRKVATHAWGAGGSLMQNIHAGFACGNTVVLELPPAAGPLHREIHGDSLRMENGAVLPPAQPGLGIRLTDDIKNRFPFVAGSGEFNSVPGKILQE